MRPLKPSTVALLEDIERRICPEAEDALDARWLRFLCGEFTGEIFTPERDVLSPPGTDLAPLHINDALADVETMVALEMQGVSRTLSNGGGNLAVRANYGTGILPTLFGAEIFEMPRETRTLPTVRPFNDTGRIRALVDAGPPDLDAGFGERVFRCGELFREIQERYPKIGRYVSVYHPDVQGPLDVCELLWGCEMFYAMYDEPELVHAFLSRITDTYIRFLEKWFELFPCGAAMNAHWASLRHRGRIALRCDSAMNLSPELYEEFAVPYDRILLERFGGGIMHFCGRGDHYIGRLCAQPLLTGVNMSQPHLNDMEVIYRNTVDRGIPLLGFPPDRARADVSRGFHHRMQALSAVAPAHKPRSSFGARTVALCLTAAALLLPARAPAQSPVDWPGATLSNGCVSAHVFRPDPEGGYYRGTRFDWSSLVGDIDVGGFRFFTEFHPGVHKPHGLDDGTGPVEEFDLENPPGFEEAEPDGLFLKIGVGVLRRTDAKAYFFNREYPLVDGGTWEFAEFAPTSTVARHTASLPGGRYGYVLERRVTLPDGGPRIRIERSLRNTGTATLRTRHYAHNFIRIGDRDIGSDYRVDLPFAPRALEPATVPPAGFLDDKGVGFTLPKLNRTFWARLQGFGPAAEHNRFTVRHLPLGASLSIATDRPMCDFRLYANDRILSPESFVDLEVAPGETAVWTTEIALDAPAPRVAPTAGGVVFPDAANVLDVKAFGAVGDGVADDTDAIQAAYDKTGLIYLPDGIYRVTRPIKAPPRPGGAPSRRILQGQSRDGTILRLDDNAPGFGDPAKPQAVLTTSWGVAQAFRNAVRDMTIEVGRGNPGAIGLAFFASNQGCVKNVRIRAADGATGHTGLSLTGDNGPLLVWNVEVEGFAIGVLGAANALATFENLSVSGQREVGFDSGLKSYIHSFRSDNKVTAVRTKNHMFILVDGTLSGGSPGVPAMVVGSNALVRDVTSSGYGRILDATKGTGVAGSEIAFWATQKPVLLNGAAEDSVRLPVKPSPDIPWGGLDGWANAMDYKPVKHHVLVRGTGWVDEDDWAPALQAAIDSGAHTVYFPAGKWHASGVVHVRGNVRRIIGCEAELRPVDTMEGMTLVVDGDAAEPLVIERFDAIYAKLGIENRSGRTLAVRHIVCDRIVKADGAGDLFLDDVCCGSVDIHGGDVWARQLNQEGSYDPEKEPEPRPNTWNDGGRFWLFGLKTEQNRTKIWTKNGGLSEIYAYILANRAENPLPMFVAEDSGVAVSVYETTLRKGPFKSILQTLRDGVPGEVAPGSTHQGGVCRPWVVALPESP